MAAALCKWTNICFRLRTSSLMFGGMPGFVNQKRTIVGKNKLKLDQDTYPEPWPYKGKGCALFSSVLS